jgi:hypothetical protein
MKLKIGLTIMLMAGTNALAQQTNNPTAPTNPQLRTPIQSKIKSSAGTRQLTVCGILQL